MTSCMPQTGLHEEDPNKMTVAAYFVIHEQLLQAYDDELCGGDEFFSEEVDNSEALQVEDEATGTEEEGEVR
ncbi:MAG: hypothetical protein N2595_05225 [bacterium]|nr:hypothetical protein [bacterium]